MPMPGAEGVLSEEAPQEGRFCVKLHNPQPYENEPINNWSQSIIAQVAKKTLLIRGYIRTKDATEAAIWVQCIHRAPWSVAGFATTSTDTPRYGTSDWEPVEMRLDAPEQTDYIMVRCVLKGQGTVWFDCLSVEIAPEETPEPAKAPVAVIIKKPETASAPTPEASPTPTPPETPASNEIPLSKQEEALAKVLQSHEDMLKRYESLRNSNSALQERIEQMRGQIETLKALLEEKRAEAASKPEPATMEPPSPQPVRPVSPLVPRFEALDEDGNNKKESP